ncbi:hypothetical protein GGS21DRAFT_487838 [Xylaria nigripes]|nr:hypothetical protein GGS21DRAFT_487838 [Xylaria nigripes]
MAASVKPSVEGAVSTDRHKINVTLSCRDSSIPERRLVLTRGLPVVRIGRSSKVHTKGFVPASDNAWFDNPVMSRQHAEIFAKFDEKGPAGVYLKDVASFHGTFLTPNDGRNIERRIAPHEPVKLTNGDIIQFGMEILRTNKTFPPCYVDFLMEEEPQKPDKFPNRTDKLSPRAFTVPDDIDDEEDGDCENEDDSSVVALVQRSSTITFKNLRNMISPSRNRPPPIDLTVNGDDLPARNTRFSTSSDIIDLTSEIAHEPNTGSYAADPSARPLSSIGSSSPDPLFPEDHSYIGPGRFSPDPFASPDESSNDWYDEDGEGGVNLDSESESFLYSDSADETNGSVEIDILSRSIDDGSSELGYEYGTSLDFESACDVDADLYFNDSDSCFSEVHERISDGVTIGPSNDDARTAPASSFLHRASHYTTPGLPAVPSSDFRPRAHEASPMPSYSIHKPSHNREPSPSDAALVKCHSFLENQPANDRAKELGEKTGKLEYFAAREENREAVNQYYKTIPTSAIRDTPLPVTQPDDHVTIFSDNSFIPSRSHSCGPYTTTIISSAKEKLLRGDFEAPDAFSIKLDDVHVNRSSAWTNSGDRFINNPPQESQNSRSQPVDFDMTSAYKFQQSKLAAEAQTLSKNRCLNIQDLLAQEPKECSFVNKPTPDPELVASEAVRDSSLSHVATPAKRTFDEAFNELEDSATHEYPSDSTNLFSPGGSKQDEQTESRHGLRTPVTQKAPADTAAADVGPKNGPAQNSASSDVRPEYSRPVKKIRVAQAIACVALGGAATFSYLVNTAPVF